METLPRMRTDVRFVPAIVQGARVVVVQDPLRPGAAIPVLDGQVVSLLPLFDGSHTLRDLQLFLMRQRGGRLVMEAHARAVVRRLDELVLLQNERYEALRARVAAAFAAAPTRESAFAGNAYPADPRELSAFLRQVVSAARPGSVNQGSVRALVAPHIDMRVGAECYGVAYATLEGSGPERVIVLGTGHALEGGLVSLTTKPYATPLGAFRPDLACIRRLQGAGTGLLCPDDFAHRNEHSVEFQVLFLQTLLPPDTPLVPVLCGSVTAWLHLESPSEIPGLAAFARALGEACEGRTLVVTGVDLSHVGPKFGDEQAASAVEAEAREHDRRILEAVCAGSAEALWAEARRVADRYHVCGLGPLTLLLLALPGLRGTVLDYRFWHEAATRSAVSFAAVALSRSEPGERGKPERPDREAAGALDSQGGYVRKSASISSTACISSLSSLR